MSDQERNVEMGKLLVSLSLVFIMLVGCVTAPTTQMIAERNSDNLLKLKMGMTPGRVKFVMGKPDFTEIYPTGSKQMVVFFYVIEDRNLDDTVTKNECARLLFENNRLAAIEK
jgi:hypothetical protein